MAGSGYREESREGSLAGSGYRDAREEAFARSESFDSRSQLVDRSGYQRHEDPNDARSTVPRLACRLNLHQPADGGQNQSH